MGLGDIIRVLMHGRGQGVDELARRLGMSAEELRAIEPEYRPFTLRKRSGGLRQIFSPASDLKAVQRRMLRRVLARLSTHPSAKGFERKQSIVTNARPHVGQAVVVRMDLKDFFDSTQAGRVENYFRKVGWNREAAGLLVRLCTHEGGLPQGAPTSPRLSNLVNYRLDARLAGLARKFHAVYTRYADDMTFSFAEDKPKAVRAVIRGTKFIVSREGYKLHQRTKLHIRRRHERQSVTGLVVNERVRLPRETRRWLRAVEHRLSKGREATLTPVQLAGWRALRDMVGRQAAT